MSEQVTGVVFYTIEEAIKTYRKFAQKRINQQELDITIDQWLVLNCLASNKDISQNHLAELTFKDVASVTRMIDLLVKKEYLIRSMHTDDRRRFALEITEKGQEIINKVSLIVTENRNIALNGLNDDDISQLQSMLRQIIENCK
jgi:Transcriptional regulators